ncbi:hypothetical protein [Dactylosporangium sp. NPDC000521]|uniref:hypothetical protein n=1 Tax=Dactylosporangium sp. NPDC000521 TaxID=3363975 RepID=UPI0036BAA535
MFNLPGLELLSPTSARTNTQRAAPLTRPAPMTQAGLPQVRNWARCDVLGPRAAEATQSPVPTGTQHEGLC